MDGPRAGGMDGGRGQISWVTTAPARSRWIAATTGRVYAPPESAEGDQQRPSVNQRPRAAPHPTVEREEPGRIEPARGGWAPM
jgi:hypothetical protein